MPGTLAGLVTLPEWYLVTAALAVVSALGFLWLPLYGAVPLLAIALGASVAQAIRGASRAVFPTPITSRFVRAQRYSLTALLHFLQPVARLHGRLAWGLSPWRHAPAGFMVPCVHLDSVWAEKWRDYDSWLRDLEGAMQHKGAIVIRGGDFDRWDLHFRRGLFASVKVMLAVEEHGQGRQLARLKMWPKAAKVSSFIAFVSILLAARAFVAGASVPAILLTAAFLGIAMRTVQESAGTMQEVSDALHAGDVVPLGAIEVVPGVADFDVSRAPNVVDVVPAPAPAATGQEHRQGGRDWASVAERA